MEDWNNPVQGRDQWWAPVNIVWNLTGIPHKAEKCLDHLSD
jgi:hypothetical protein